MNTALCTGWLQTPGNKAYTSSGAPKLKFDLMVANEPGEPPTPWTCEIVDVELIARAEDLLTCGRALIVAGKLCGRPYIDRGVTKGFTRYLRITEVEFAKPDRGNAVQIAEEEEAAT